MHIDRFEIVLGRVVFYFDSAYLKLKGIFRFLNLKYFSEKIGIILDKN